MDIPVVEGLVRAGAQVFQTTLGPCGNLEGQTRRAHKSAIAALGQVDAVINILSLPPASPIGTTSFDELRRKVWLEIEQPWRAFRLAISVLRGGCMITLVPGAKNPSPDALQFSRATSIMLRCAALEFSKAAAPVRANALVMRHDISRDEVIAMIDFLLSDEGLFVAGEVFQLGGPA